MPARRFPPPWSVEELDACFVVTDSAGQQLAYGYFEDEPGRAFSTTVMSRRRFVIVITDRTSKSGLNRFHGA